MKTEKILTEKDVIQIIEKKLPEIIEKRPEVRRKIEQILEKKSATKDDIKAVLQELARQREELIKLREDFHRHTEESNRRFEEINRRFEEINRRFEKTDKRFEEINRRFEKMDKRFEEINRRFEEMKEGFMRLDRKIDALGSRWGYSAEDAFRKGFEEILPDLGYKVIKWRKMDEKGEIFLRPRPVEIDIIIKNKKRIAIEIKSSLTCADVTIFERSIRFYEKIEKEKVDKKIMVTLFPYPGVKEYAKSLKIKVIESGESAKEYLLRQR